MKRFITACLLLSMALFVGCGGSSNSSTSNPSATTKTPKSIITTTSNSIILRKNAKLKETVLTNVHGFTLYALSGERAGKFICVSASCLKAWYPLVAASNAPPKCCVGSLGVVKRPDSSEQITYKGQPLYTFPGDANPGRSKGQGIKDAGGTWQAVVR